MIEWVNRVNGSGPFNIQLSEKNTYGSCNSPATEIFTAVDMKIVHILILL